MFKNEREKGEVVALEGREYLYYFVYIYLFWFETDIINWLFVHA